MGGKETHVYFLNEMQAEYVSSHGNSSASFLCEACSKIIFYWDHKMSPNLTINGVSVPHSYLSSVRSCISYMKKCLGENGE